MMSVPFIISYGVLLPIMGIVNDEKWREALATFAMVCVFLPGHYTMPEQCLYNAHQCTPMHIIQLLGSVPAARAGKLPNRAVAELYDLTITFVSVFVVCVGL